MTFTAHCQPRCTETNHSLVCQNRGRSAGEHRCANCGSVVTPENWNGYHLCPTHREAFLRALARDHQ